MSRKLHPITGCRADTLFGTWFMDSMTLDAVARQALSYDLNDLVKMNQRIAEDNKDKPADKGYTVKDGVGIMQVSGVLTKYPTSFSNVIDNSSYKQIENTLTEMAHDPAIKTTLMHFDGCPGGTAAGSVDCGQVIAKLSKVKPIHAHISDQGTSAGYLLASQASRVTANQTAEVGSIGTVAVLHDLSGRYEKEGIKVIPVASGRLKAAGAPGTEVTPDQIAYLQERVDSINRGFLTAVQSSRKFTDEKMQSIAKEARVYSAPQALEIGLIDGIARFEDVVDQLSQHGPVTTDKPKTVFSGVKPTRSSAMALTAEQLKLVRALPGADAAQITEENAESKLLDIAMSMSTELSTMKTQMAGMVAKPATVDPTILAGRQEILEGRISLLVDQGFVTKAQADALKSSLTTEAMMTPVAGVAPYQNVLKALELNKPNGLRQETTPGQPVARTEPGDQPAQPDPFKGVADAYLSKKHPTAKKDKE